MASHLSLTTVIFSLLRRYYIRVTEISRSMTSACCCCCDSPRDRSLTIRWNRIESNVIYSTLSVNDQSCSNLDFTFLSDPTIRVSNFIHTWTLAKKKERKCKRIVIAHARERKVSYIESNFENLKFKIENFGLWSFFFFFENGETASRILENNTFQRFQNTSKYYYVINKDVPSGF